MAMELLFQLVYVSEQSIRRVMHAVKHSNKQQTQCPSSQAPHRAPYMLKLMKLYCVLCVLHVRLLRCTFFQHRKHCPLHVLPSTFNATAANCRFSWYDE